MTVAEAFAPPQTPRLTARSLATGEVFALLGVLDSLDAEHWTLPTDCERWRVREIVAHVVGAAEESVRFRTLVRHSRDGRKRYRDEPMLDGLNEAQIDDRRTWPVPALLAAAHDWLPRAVRARARPLPIRRIPLPLGEPLGTATLAYLNDVIYLRDLWMHRVDITRAARRPFDRHDHEAEIVRQVLRDLAAAWAGPAVLVRLDGPAAGTYRIGAGDVTGEVAVTDDVEWLRVLSGRPATAPLEVVAGDPPLELLTVARVAF